MPWTQSQLTALDDAIAQGVLTVKYQDRTVTYRTLDEMLKLRETMKQELGLTEGRVRLYARHSKGIE